MRKVYIYSMFVFFCFFSVSHSAPHSGQVFELVQPDGSLVQVKVYGDEYYQRVESLDGYTLVRNSQTGWIEYAETNDDDSDFIATDVVYNHRVKTNPAHPSFRAMAKRFNRLKAGAGDNEPVLTKSKRLRRDVVLKKVRERMKEIDPPFYNKMFGPATDGQASQGQYATTASGSDVSMAPLSGSVIGLTLLIDFSDQPATIPQADIEQYCNQPGYTGYGNASSVYDYFYGVSNGQLQYTNYVTAYYRASHPKSYYDNSCGGGLYDELVDEALRWLDSTGFNFNSVSVASGRIRALNVFYAGETSCGWSKGLWPSSRWYAGFTSNDGVSSGSYQISNIGSSPSIYVFCHENGHMICGYPDLYDYGGESAGVGNYCVMAGRPDDKRPMPPCGYLRSTTGWETVIDITSDPVGTLRQHTANTNVSFKYSNPNKSSEFFMIESRLKTGRNAVIPDEGLIIWHIDENGSNDNQEMTPASHYKVSVEQADGLFHLEHNNNAGGSGDLFHAGDKDKFDDYTLPSAYWWIGNPSGFSVTQISAVSGQMNFTLGASQPSGYWKFDGSGLDSSGAGKTITGYNFSVSPWSTDTWSGGLVNLDRCVVFDGVDDYAQVSPVADGATSMGAAFWFCPDTVIETVLVDKFPSGSGGAGWRIWLDGSGRLHFTVGSGDASTDLMTGQPVAVPGLWRHAACTFAGGKGIIFINGQQVAEMTEVTRTPASSEPVTVGKSNAVALGQPFAGRMDELIIYASSLNDTRIKSFPGLNFAGRYGLSGYWKFDEITGTTAADSSALANDAILNGGMAFGANSVAGKVGKALSFDGTDDYVLAGAGSATPGTGFSVCLWAYPTAVKNWARFIDFGNGSGSDNLLLSRYMSTNDLVFETYNGTTSGSIVRATGAIELNTWQFFAATIDTSGNVKLYKNGTQVASGTSAVMQKITRSNAFIGRSNWSADAYYQGLMDEVKTFNYVLTQSQIQSLMTGIESHSPTPADYCPAASERIILQWHGSSNAVMYAVYLGTSSTAVAAATTASPEFMGYRSVPQFNPGSPAVNAVYYWRVDTILENGRLLTGPVWNFTTSGSLTRQVYTGITGTVVSNLTGASKYPNSPDIYEYIPTIECPTNWSDNYGTRLEGYLTPQTSGSYTFWIASDDASELWFSTDSSLSNMSKIAYLTGWTDTRQWTKYSTQVSTARTLTAGQRYYFGVLQKEGDGGDNLAVAWQGPDSPTRSVIQSRFLSPHDLKPAPKFASSQITKPNASEKIAYVQSLASDLSSGSGTFTKIGGPDWLTISSDGALTGTPPNGENGQNSFTAQIRDSLNRIDQAVVQIDVAQKYDGGLGMPDLPGFAQNWLATDLNNPAELNGGSPVDLQDLAVFSSNWQEDVIPGLVAHWTMDDAIYSVVRDSYGGHDGQIRNTVWDGTVPGRLEGALLLDGVDDYVEITGYKGITGTSSRTCSAWIKTSGSSTNTVIVDWGAAVAGQKWLFGIFSTGELVIYTSPSYIKTNRTVTDNQWHHVAAVLVDDGTPDVSEIKLYVDGLLQTTTVSSAQAINTVASANVLIGAFDTAGTKAGYFKGLIDDVRIYNRALNLDEILETAPAEIGLAAEWKLDENAGTAAKDALGVRDGILRNTTGIWVAGKTGNALTFDGVDDYVEIPGYKGITGTSSRTCSAWIKTSGSSVANTTIMDWGAAVAGQKWLFGIFTTGKLVIFTWPSYIQTNITVTDNQWHHVAAVLNDDGTPDVTEIKLYVDGLLQTTTVSSAQAINTVPAADVLLGAFDTAGTKAGYFNGLIDDMRIYNRPLADAEIAVLAQ